MAAQDLVGTARGVVEAFNAADWERTKALLTEDSVYDEVGTSRCLTGHNEIIPALQGWREGMPDVTGTVESAVATGDRVVLEITWRGTHTGPLPGPSGTIAATGKPQTTRSGWVLDFEGDRVKRSHHYFDMLSFMQQIGVV
jgi:steroid delta-isomerase-like uncharacterized protein